MTGLNTTIVAPSSALGDAERLQQGIELLRSWGHTIRSAPDPTPGTGGITPAVMPSAWLISLAKRSFGPAPVAAGEPRGCWSRAGNRRRGWLLGFSDVTSLLWAQQAAGLSGAIHGPLVTTLAAEPTVEPKPAA